MEYLLTVEAAELCYTYTLKIYVPDVSAPVEGFPVTYVLDGGWYYDIVKSTVMLQSKNEKTKVAPQIVVAICHNEADARARRFYDFTAEAAQYVFPERTKGKHMDTKQYGGAAKFWAFLLNDVKKVVRAECQVNDKAETLYGHSLGGYFTLWCYLHHPHSFTHYIAVSPSVWWNDFELHKQLVHRLSDPPLHIAVGERESFMVPEITSFYKELQSEKATLYVAPEENHASVVPTTISRLLRFI